MWHSPLLIYERRHKPRKPEKADRRMSSEVPESIKILEVLANTWHYFFAGLLSLGGIAAIVRKGKKEELTILPVSEKDIDNKLLISRLESEKQMRDEFYAAIARRDHLLLERIEQLLKVYANARNDK